jgi:hypothetical protein
MPDVPYLGVRVVCANGVQADISPLIRQITFSSLINGGFGTMTFFVPWLHNRGLPPWLQFLADVRATDRFAFTCFEGRIDDISLSVSGDSEGYQVECVGYGVALGAEPYTNVIVERNLPFVPLPIIESPQFMRSDLYGANSGNTNATDLTRSGVAFSCRRNQLYPVTAFYIYRAMWPDLGVDLRRVKFDVTTVNLANGTFVGALNCYSCDSAGVLTTQVSIAAAGTFNEDIALPAGTRGVAFGLICTTGGTTGAFDTTAEVFNVRVFGNRTNAASNNEPVYGHEIVTDIVQKSLWSQDLTQIETDTTYQFPEASWVDSIKIADALDYVTSFYDRWWAVYEDKRFFWKSANAQIVNWSTSRAEGARLQLDPSITNAARSVRLRYRVPSGQSAELIVADTRVDNVYAAAGASHTAIVDLGIVSNATSAAQVGQTYFPDHSYEVVKGTITLQLNQFVRGLNPGPAYRIRAGDNIQVRDAVSPRQILGQSYDRRSIFLVRSVDVDWDSQTVTVSVDNTRDSLSQLLARVGIAVPASPGAPANSNVQPISTNG